MSTERDSGSKDTLAVKYATRLLDLVLSRGNTMPRTYGFEYEFLPDRMLNHRDIYTLREFLSLSGYILCNGIYHDSGNSIVFEPGGQIEYLSPPMRAFDGEKLKEVLNWICCMNREIEKETGIRYVGTDFIPGRQDSPLLLASHRYASMHDRFSKVDNRGTEMMKGTAAIHLHAAITSSSDLELLYANFCRMTSSPILGMSSRRREIWDSTDSCRCGLPLADAREGALSILECVVTRALDAVELFSGQVYRTLDGTDFEDFLDHLTTMFTDVRVNVKGGTLELRTPDSRPLEEFPILWEEFVGQCEQISPDLPS